MAKKENRPESYIAKLQRENKEMADRLLVSENKPIIIDRRFNENTITRIEQLCSKRPILFSSEILKIINEVING